MRAVTAVVFLSLALTALTAGCGARKSKPSALEAKQASIVFDQSRMIDCLHRLLLPYDYLHGSQLTTPLNEFRGLTGSDLTLASPSPSDLGAKARIDTVQMFFFKTPQQARKAQARLAQIYVYFHGPFASLRYLRPVPPDAFAAHSIERIAGNIDIFWEYPRHHPAESDRTLNRCLAASHGGLS